jgi:hypothetical protein
VPPLSSADSWRLLTGPFPYAMLLRHLMEPFDSQPVVPGSISMSSEINASTRYAMSRLQCMLIDIYMDGFSLHWRSAPLRRTVNYRVGLFVRVTEGLEDSDR